jgi:hypothetical protein
MQKKKSKSAAEATNDKWWTHSRMGLASLSLDSEEDTMNRRHLFSVSAVAALALALLPSSAVGQQKSHEK